MNALCRTRSQQARSACGGPTACGRPTNPPAADQLIRLRRTNRNRCQVTDTTVQYNLNPTLIQFFAGGIHRPKLASVVQFARSCRLRLERLAA